MEYYSDEDDDYGEIDFDLDTNAEPTNPLVPEKHLDSPIMVSLLHRLKSEMQFMLSEHSGIRATQYDIHRVETVRIHARRHPERMYSSFTEPLMQYAKALDFCKVEPEILDAKHYPFLYKLCDTTAYRIHSDMRIALQVFETELDDYLRYVKDLLPAKQVKKMRNDMLSRLEITDDIILSAKRVQLWSDLVDKYRKQYKNNQHIKKIIHGPLRVVICDGFLLLKHTLLTRWQLLTYEQLQMIQDCCMARHNVQLALTFGFHNGTNRLEAHVRRVLNWQEAVLNELGNDGYELVKAPEAIFKTWLNQLTNGDLLTYSSYERTLDKMHEKERKLRNSTEINQPQPLIMRFKYLTELVTDVGDAAELFGLSKLSGHPSVYAEKSARSVRTEAEPQGTVHPFAVKQMTRMFKHLVLSGYINYHSEWPPFVCPPRRGTTLRRHYMNRVTSLPMGSYPISDLDAIQFGKFVDYDYSEDYLKFLDDKAICPGARQMSKFWFKSDNDEPRRLLHKVLQMKEFDTVKMVERLRRGKFKPDEYVVELTQKERELKTAARCFCKLVFEVRTFFTSTEYNLKEQFMSRYMPQQTMTMSNTDTKKRLYNMVKDARSRRRTLLEVDFSRWNLRWRHTTVQPISFILEDIFGLPGVFSQAHPFFTKATIVLTDKHSLPLGADYNRPVTEWPTSELLWRGTHLGGFEGIQQALWTICTIAMMYWVLYDQQLSFLMAGQGDNQIFTITFDETNENMSDQLRKLLAIMELRCSLLNHEVKPDECIDSQTVLTYSKDIYVEGNHVLYNLKFASRSFRRDEIDIPSLSTEVAGISAVSMACADSILNTPLAIFWKTYLTIRFFSYRYRAPLYEIEKPTLRQILSNERLFRFVLRIPGSLGGLPIMQWTRFFLKGEVDDVSWDVPSVMLSKFRDIRWDLNLLTRGDYSPQHPNLTQLLLDPHSLPINRPKDMKRLVKEAVERNILSHTKNVWLREIFTDATTLTSEILLENLTRARPLYPQILSDIYKLSPSGVRDAMLSRFTMTRTISNLVSKNKFSYEIEAGNARLLQTLIDRFHNAVSMHGEPQFEKSCYHQCQKLRKLWGEHVEHRNVGTYNPLDFKLRFTRMREPMISMTARCDSDSTPTKVLGPYPPNFGTRTRQKVSDHGFKIVTSSSTVADLKRLVLTFSELGQSDSLCALIDRIVAARSPWALRQLVNVLPTSIGGSALHRHDKLNAQPFSILGSRTIPTHLNFCSDLSGVLSGGEDDYPIAYQEFYLTLTNVYQVLTLHRVLDNNCNIGFQLSNDYEPLPTDTVEIEGQIRPFRWDVKPNNALCYVNTLQLREIPLVPDKSEIPRTDPQGLKPAFIIYNRLMSKYAGTKKIIRSTTAVVNLPVEILDMKEFNHCPLNELLVGTCYFIITMSIFTAVRSYSRDAHVFLYGLILRLSQSCAGLLARLMLHPSFCTSRFAITNSILIEPGIAGARSASDSLVGELAERCRLMILSRQMLTERVPLLFFADYGVIGRLQAEAHVTSIVSQLGVNPNKIELTSYQRLVIHSARYNMFKYGNTLTTICQILAAGRTLTENVRSRKSGISSRNAIRYFYINLTSDEVIRLLRKRPRESPLQRVEPVNDPTLIGSMKELRCRFSRDESDGCLRPLHVCPETTPDDRKLDSLLSLLLRPDYLYSSAINIWKPLLNTIRRYLIGSTVVSIGVGHGAVASTVINLGASQVYGVDLRSSFPAITQREGTYKPPEVLRTGHSERFEWSDFVAETGGDFIKHHSLLNTIEDAHVIIVDIEQDPVETMVSISKLRPCQFLIARFIVCDEWARFVADALDTTEVYCTSILPTHKRSFVFFKYEFRGLNLNANYERLQFSQCPRWKRRVERSNVATCSLINKWLRPTGCQMRSATIGELARIRPMIQNLASNTDSAILQQRLYGTLSDIDALRQFVDAGANVKRLNELVLSNQARRVGAMWLANDRTYNWDELITAFLE